MTEQREQILDGGYRTGDFVTRGGDDVHQCRNPSADGLFAEFVCVVAPASGWCAVGDVEWNQTRRYTPTSAPENTDADRFGVGN